MSTGSGTALRRKERKAMADHCDQRTQLMLDKYLIPRLRPPLHIAARQLRRLGVSADRLTVAGFLVGVAAVPLVAFDHPWLALACLLLNRLADGLDGELARLGSPTDAGGYLDFALADPLQNGVPAAVLIASFMGTGASFLAFASLAGKRSIDSPDFAYKSLYYLNGLAEGSETVICFALMCLLPTYFPVFAWGFALLCLITAANRIKYGYRTLR
jgi:phosphatidylglycerophosphate synthase